MTRISCVLFATLLGACATVTSAQPGITNATGEGWYTEAIGFMGLKWGSRTYYCPPPSSGRPAVCKEAKMIPLSKAEVAAQKEDDKRAHSGAPSQTRVASRATSDD